MTRTVPWRRADRARCNSTSSFDASFTEFFGCGRESLFAGRALRAGKAVPANVSSTNATNTRNRVTVTSALISLTPLLHGEQEQAIGQAMAKSRRLLQSVQSLGIRQRSVGCIRNDSW